MVEKYDKEYLGREVEMDWAYVNPFTGYIHFNDLRMYDSADTTYGSSADSVFFNVEGLSIRFSMRKLFSKNYEIKELVIDRPKTTIIQTRNKKIFNFSDILEKLLANDGNEDTTKAPVHFSLLDLEMNDGEIHFREESTPVNYFIKQVNFESEGMRWNVDSIIGKLSFVAGIGSGEVKTDFVYHIKSQAYQAGIVVKKLDMTIFEQYMLDLSNYGTLRAFFDADVQARGSLKDARELDAKGKLTLSDFHLGKNAKEDYASFDKLMLDIERLYPSEKIVQCDTVMLDHPFFRYEKYDKLDNLQNMFGKGGSNVKEAKADEEHFNLLLEIGEYVEKLAKNFFHNDYKIRRVEINKADLQYVDYSLGERFFIAASPLTIEADSVDKKRDRAKLTMHSEIKPYGDMELILSMNPKDSSDFDLNFRMEKVSMATFNPYLISYTSYPLDRGTLEFTGKWKVRNGNINSDNHLLVVDPRTARRVKKKDAKWIPTPLIMAFVRERGNVIDYEIPISGNLKDPKFHLRDVIFDLLANIFIKPPTFPYGIKVTETERKIEKMLSFKWEMNQSILRYGQERFLDKMADFLKENPGASITVSPLEYAEKEKEYLLLYEAKKKYFLASNKKDAGSFSQEDSLSVTKMSIKDPSFIKYLDQKAGHHMLFTVQSKCEQVVGNSMVNKKYKQLKDIRERNFRDFFARNGTEEQVKMVTAKNGIPYNGFSVFRIAYKGDIPEDVRKAYEELDELDEKYPREKYKNERKKLKDIFKLSTR